MLAVVGDTAYPGVPWHDRLTGSLTRSSGRRRLALFGSLYPDEPPPAALDSLAEKVDFLARLCSAWDFGLLPDGETLCEIRHRAWRKSVDWCRL
jgi:hypothetical protein